MDILEPSAAPTSSKGSPRVTAPAPLLPIEQLRVGVERELTKALTDDAEFERVRGALALPDPKAVRRRILGRAILLTETMAPEIHASAREAATRLGLDRPIEIFQTQGPENAAIHLVDQPILIEVQGRLLTLLDPGAALAMLGHELGHYLAHGPEGGVADAIVAAQLLATAEAIDARLQRKAQVLSMAKELTADRFALLACRDLDAALRLEMVATTGLPGSALTWDTKAYLEQCRTIVEAALGDGERALGVTHPEHNLRAYALALFAESDVYRAITGEGPGTRTLASIDAVLDRILRRPDLDTGYHFLEGAPREAHECALACSVFVALADGELSEVEAAAIERVFAPLVPDFRWYLNLENAHQRFAEVGGVVAWAGDDTKRALFQLLAHIIGADGKLEDAEVDMVVAVGDALGCGTLYRALLKPLFAQFGREPRDLSSAQAPLALPPRPGEARDALRALFKGYRRRRGAETPLRRLLRLVGERHRSERAVALVAEELERAGLATTPPLAEAELDTVLRLSVSDDAPPTSEEHRVSEAERARAREAALTPDRERVVRALSRLRDKLVSGDGRSPAVRLYAPRVGRTFDLHALEALSVGLGERVLAKVRAGTAAELVLAAESGRHDGARKLLAELVELEREARARTEETGARDLFLGYPFLTGVVDGYLFRGPVVLWPVDLVREDRGARSFSLAPRADEAPVANQALVRLLFRRRGFAFPDDLAQRLDDLAADPAGGPEAVLAEIGKLGVSAVGLTGALGELRDRAGEIAAWKGTRFEIEECAVLGLFPQSGSDLLRDYDELVADLGKPGADVGHLLGAARELLPADLRAAFPLASEGAGAGKSVDAPIVPILGADPSQREVVERARTAPALVVDGPPGTGKSQVIVNLLLDALGRGERVAVVCEKRAALDVVAQRLASAGFRQAYALVHDVHEDRRDVYRQIAARLDDGRERAPAAADPKPCIDDARRVAQALELRTKALGHRPEGMSLTAGQLHALVAGVDAPDLHAAPSGPGDLTAITDAVLPTVLDRVCAVRPYRDLLAPGSPFVAPEGAPRRPSLHEATEHDVRALESDLARAIDGARRVERLRAALPIDPEMLKKAERGLDLVRSERTPEDAVMLVRAARAGAEGAAAFDAIDAALSAWSEHGEAARRVGARVRWSAPAQAEHAVTLMLAWAGRLLRFFVLSWWGARKRVRGLLESAWPERAAAPLDAELLADTRARLSASKAWTAVDACIELIGLRAAAHATADRAAELVERLGRVAEDARKLAKARAALRAIEAWPEHDPGDDDASAAWAARVDRCRELLDAVREHERACDPLRRVVPWLDALPTSAALERLHEAWKRDGSRLVELDRRRANLRAALPDGDHLLDALVAIAPDAEASAWRDAVTRAFGAAWIAKLERSVPELADLDRPTAFGDEEAAGAELERLVARSVELERGRILARLEEGALLTAAPALKGRRRTTDQAAREAMLKECRKQRSIMPLRAFVREFAPRGLLDVVPVWLLSPETMAVIFPREPLFDLVIVDEASQCTVEGGLPALLRGRRVVVSGDEKQMPPTSFFASSLELEREETTVATDAAETLDAESLLTLARARVEHAGLSWHYRCREEELIAFSNHAMYAGALLTIPSTTSRRAAPALRWVDVEAGEYDGGRNVVEARRVVDVVFERLTAPRETGRPSIGVVTFNLQQRKAILDEIDARRAADEAFAKAWDEAAGSERLEERPFVKNLENVQGDERDVIVFSLGHAPLERRIKTRSGRDTEERVERYVPSRFGPLGQAGGERRLNVAISRAKEECVIVASFEPAMLSVAQAKNDGPKLFKLFLEFARHLSKSQWAAADRTLDAVREEAPSEVSARRAPRGPDGYVPLAVQIATALEARGLACELDVGSSRFRVPIAVVDPKDRGRYALAVLVDDGEATRGAFEAHVHTPAVLRARGWTVARVGARAWQKNPSAEIDRLVRALGVG